MVQLLAMNTSLVLFQELPIPFLTFSIQCVENESNLMSPPPSTWNIQSDDNTHHSLSLLPPQKNINMNQFIIEDYISRDENKELDSIRSDMYNDTSFLSFLLKYCEEDSHLLYRVFWLIKTAAISSAEKEKIRYAFIYHYNYPFIWRVIYECLFI